MSFVGRSSRKIFFNFRADVAIDVAGRNATLMGRCHKPQTDGVVTSADLHPRHIVFCASRTWTVAWVRTKFVTVRCNLPPQTRRCSAAVSADGAFGRP